MALVVVLWLMPLNRQGQFETHEIHHGKEPNCMSAFSRRFKHYFGDRKIWFSPLPPILRENTLGMVGGLPLLFPSTRGLQLDGYLEYFHASKAQSIHKHQCLLGDSNPGPAA
ncbi:hypothetical protein TNCV_615511 [Trichonephila clavipes]|nr:hypothetical protein TNCV_615511 [Trichonephila clavipes]